jgi:TRAP-type C4-dicarboxylate transport system permease small subunit
MLKIFANWMMDIAKYVITALVLSTALGLQEMGWIYYAACFGFVVIVIALALYLYRKDKNNNNS